MLLNKETIQQKKNENTFELYTRSLKVLQVKVDLGIMAIKVTPHSPELEPHHQMQVSVILRKPYFYGKVYPLCRGYILCILSPNY